MKARRPARTAGVALACAAALTVAPAAGAAVHHDRSSRRARGAGRASHNKQALRHGSHTRGHHGVTVTVKVLGQPPAYKKLLSSAVTLGNRPVVKGGGSCTGMSAAGALQVATRGDWAGTWDSEFSDWEVTRIEGLDLPFKTTAAANWYWKFMVDGKEASAGICAVHPKSGQTLLFKPACYGKACPKPARKASAGAADRRSARHHRG